MKVNWKVCVETENQGTNYSLKEVCENDEAREELTAGYHHFFYSMTVEEARAFVRSRGLYIGNRSTKDYTTNVCVKVRMSEVMSGKAGTKFEEIFDVRRHGMQFDPLHDDYIARGS